MFMKERLPSVMRRDSVDSKVRRWGGLEGKGRIEESMCFLGLMQEAMKTAAKEWIALSENDKMVRLLLAVVVCLRVEVVL